MSKNLIFTATYNEKDNIKELLEKINKYGLTQIFLLLMTIVQMAQA